MASSGMNKSSDHIVRSPFPGVTIPNTNIPDFIWRNVDNIGNNPAVTCGISGRSYSYKEAQTTSRRFGAALLKRGFRPGKVLAIMLPSMPEFSVVMLGALEAGLLVVLTDSTYKSNELLPLIQTTGANGMVTLPSLVPLVKGMIKQLKREMTIITVSYGEAEIVDEELEDFHDLVNNDAEAVLGTRAQPNDIALLLSTSGTTGTNKIVPWTHKNLVANFVQKRAFANNVTDNSSDHVKHSVLPEYQEVLIAALPPGRGFLTLAVLGKLATGAHIITLPTWEPRTFLNTVSNQKPLTVELQCNPLMFYDIQSLAKTKDLQSVRTVFHSAGFVTSLHMENLSKIMQNRKDVTFGTGYGLTETMCICSSVVVPSSYNPEAIGYLCSNTQAKIVGPSGKNLGPEEVGEIYVKGPQVTKGYFNNDKATAEAFDDDGWFKTGDAACYDQNGMFYLKGRLKELIKVGGRSVSPVELEATLMSHPCVADSAVLGVPDHERIQEKPIAFIVPKPGAHLRCDEVIEFAAEHTAPYKRLSQIIVKDSLPRNLSGKVMKFVLKEEYLKTIQIL